MTFVCAYYGPPNECRECGGFDRTGTGFCDHDCAASHDARRDAQAAVVQARRDCEEAFGREIDRLRALGHTDAEIEVLTAGMPT